MSQKTDSKGLACRNGKVFLNKLRETTLVCLIKRKQVIELVYCSLEYPIYNIKFDLDSKMKYSAVLKYYKLFTFYSQDLCIRELWTAA